MLRTRLFTVIVPTLVLACGADLWPIPSSYGASDTYVVVDDAMVTNSTRKISWQRQRSELEMSLREAQAYCARVGLRLPTREDLWSLGNWGHANVARADEAFPQRDLWAGYWSTTGAPGGNSVGVDFTGTIPDSLGIPVVDCPMPAERKRSARCIR